MRSTTFLLLFCTTFFLACEKEKKPPGISIDRFYSIMDSVTIDCGGIGSLKYVSGKLNGQAFCYSDGTDGYTIQTRPVHYFTTQGASFTYSDSLSGGSNPKKALLFTTQSGLLENYVDEFFVLSPVLDGVHAYDKLVERFIVPGNYKVLAQHLPDSTGFNIGFKIWYDAWETQPGVFAAYVIQLSSNYGQQRPESYFRIGHVSITTQGGSTIYQVTFEFECQLYHGVGSPLQNELYGDLTDGKMVFEILVPG